MLDLDNVTEVEAMEALASTTIIASFELQSEGIKASREALPPLESANLLRALVVETDAIINELQTLNANSREVRQLRGMALHTKKLTKLTISLLKGVA